MTHEDFQKTKWLSIYGASVALQCHQQMLDGKGGDFTDSIKNIKEEAAAIADWAMEDEQL